MRKIKIHPLIVVLLLIIIILFLYSLCTRTEYSMQDGGVFNENNDLNIEDNNNNGIWDDIEPFIKKHSTHKVVQLALEQYVKKLQGAIKDPEGMGEYYASNSQYTGKEFECLEKVKEKYPVEIDVSNIQDAIVNNTARAQAYLKYNQKLSGGIYPDWDYKTLGNPCDFNF